MADVELIPDGRKGILKFNGKQSGSYEYITMSENPKIVKVVGSYKSKDPGIPNYGDAFHSFERRVKPESSKFGGKMNTIVDVVLKEFYDAKINPDISSLKVDMNGKTGVVSYEAIIKESTDGKAWIGLMSRGGCGHNGDMSKRQKQKDEGAELKDILDYKLGKGENGNPCAFVRQLFWVYTSKKYPPHPKTPGAGAPTPETSTTQEPTAPPVPLPPAPKFGYLIDSKITLKKFSGPGEIIGITEVEAKEGIADFSGIQFSDPGDYVIQVIPSNTTDLLSTTFSIKVEPSDEVIEQPSSAQDDNANKGNRPIIAQIDEPRIKLAPMVSPAAENDGDSNSQVAESLGMTPFVYYAGSQIKPDDVVSMEIFYQNFVPQISLKFKDSLGLLSQPQSSTAINRNIQVFLNSGSANLKSIHMDFIVTTANQKDGTYIITGQLNIPEFYKSSRKSYRDTTFNALREFAKDMGLGFNSNINETNDSQVWSRKGGTGSDFMKEILQRAYINDETFLMAYIDFYYCLTYVDVEKEYTRDNSKDIGISSTGTSLASDKGDIDKIVPMILNNEVNKNNASAFTFMEPKTINASESVKIQQGSQTEIKTYDRLKKKFLVFVQDVITGDQRKNVIPRTEDDINTNTRPSFRGKIDTDNVHATYNDTLDNQIRNMNYLTNNLVELTLPVSNFNLYKYQKIKIIFVNQANTATNTDDIDVRKSGDWMILDIRYVYIKGTLGQRLLVGRKELNKTPEEQNQQVIQPDKTANGEINENPDVPGENKPIPNQIYYVGQKVLVKQNDNSYIIEVLRVLENGTQIEGKIVDYLIIPEPVSTSGTSGTSGAAGTSGTSGAVGTSGTSGEVSTNASNDNQKKSTGYKVTIANPTSENDKNIIGQIDIKKVGPKKNAIGTLTGFPAGRADIGPIEGQASFTEDEIPLVEEMILILENKLQEYGVRTKLKYEKNQ